MHIYILMGVSGVGKTTIGKKLAERLNLDFYDADDFHTPENIHKMKQGVPLEDSDRRLWLESLTRKIKEWYQQGGAVVAFSGLKQEYRDRLKTIPEEDLTWIFLHSEYETIFERLSTRQNHFFEPELLQSQYDILEIPESGIHVDVKRSKQEVINTIMDHIKGKHQKSSIGIAGLGVMGKSLALNMASRDMVVSVYNRNVESFEVDVAKNFALTHREHHAFPWFDELESFVASLEKPRNILLMVRAGKAVDGIIEDLVPLLEEGDLIIDGGNSHYMDTQRRTKTLQKKGIFFMGCGISGGEEGARNGPSIMPGGSRDVYDRVGKFLEQIAARDRNGKPCCSFLGPGGSGHFVKMVHNGIEYGEMQLIAESYHFLRFHQDIGPEEIAAVFEDWNTEMRSFLLEITIDILRKKEDKEPLIDLILDAAQQKGTGGWSTSAALELGVPLDTITAAVMARNISAIKETRVKAQKRYKANDHSFDGKLSRTTLLNAMRAASIINHSIGFHLLAEASKAYDWDLDLSEVARIWTSGCIIRSAFMEDLSVFLQGQQMDHLLLHPKIIPQVTQDRTALLETTHTALKAGFPMPVLSAATNYFLNFTSERSSANMIQAQRDYFGAHTYERTDKARGEFFHTQWSE